MYLRYQRKHLGKGQNGKLGWVDIAVVGESARIQTPCQAKFLVPWRYLPVPWPSVSTTCFSLPDLYILSFWEWWFSLQAMDQRHDGGRLTWPSALSIFRELRAQVTVTPTTIVRVNQSCRLLSVTRPVNLRPAYRLCRGVCFNFSTWIL